MKVKIPVAELIPGDKVFSVSANGVMYSVVELLGQTEDSIDFAARIRYENGLEITKYWKDPAVEVTVDRA